jgi:hypothetical protein
VNEEAMAHWEAVEPNKKRLSDPENVFNYKPQTSLVV